MAIPRSKYSEPRHTPGKEYQLDGTEYVGWYVVTFQNIAYTGKELTINSKKLDPFVKSSVPVDPFFEQEVRPLTADKNRGIYNRYLIQKKSTLKIIEVTKEVYGKFANLAHYRRVIVPWIIKGPADNLILNGYPYYGAAHRNKETVFKLESTFPGIINFFKDYSEFVE